MIYTGETASYILQQNLEDHKTKKCRGYFSEGMVWIAFDNSTKTAGLKNLPKKKMQFVG